MTGIKVRLFVNSTYSPWSVQSEALSALCKLADNTPATGSKCEQRMSLQLTPARASLKTRQSKLEFLENIQRLEFVIEIEVRT